MGKFKRLYKKIGQIEKLISGLFMVFIMIIVFLSGVGRAIGHPLNWAIDLSTFLFAWAAFFSADVAMREDRHLNVKFLVNKFPEKLQYYIAILNHVIIMIFLGYLIRYGVIQTYSTRFRTFQGIPNFSYAWATLSVPVGSLLLLISTFVKLKKIYDTRKADIFKMEVKEKVDNLNNN